MENVLVTINVGGEVFLTTSSTLQSLPNTLLADLMNPEISFADAIEIGQPFYKHGKRCTKLPHYGMKWKKCECHPAHETKGECSACQQNRRSRYIFVTESSVFGHLKLSTTSSTPTTSRVEESATRVSNHSDRTDETPSLTDVSPSPCQSENNNNDVPPKLRQNHHHHPKEHHSNQGRHHNHIPPRHATIMSLPGNFKADLFIDRNPVLMPYILDAYRLGQLHLPANVCSLAIREELDFWKIPEDMISECCWKNFHEGLRTMKIVNAISSSLYEPYEDPTKRNELSVLGRIWLTMERPSYNWSAKIWCFIYYLCILLSSMIFMFSATISELKPEFEQFLHHLSEDNVTLPLLHAATFYRLAEPYNTLEQCLRVYFTAEVIIRLFTCPDKKAFLRNKHNITDIVITLVVWIRYAMDTVINNNAEHYNTTVSYAMMVTNCLVSMTVVRAIHLAKHLKSLKIMYLSIRASMKELMLLVILLAIAVLLFGTAVFMAELLSTEDNDQLEFNSIPIAMWWAVVTMTTVGYGDFYPRKPGGYAVGVACAITGLLLVAMPIAIVASNFTNYNDNTTSVDQAKRRKEVMENVTEDEKQNENGNVEASSNTGREHENDDVAELQENFTEKGNNMYDRLGEIMHELPLSGKDNKQKLQISGLSHPSIEGKIKTPMRAFSLSEDDTYPAQVHAVKDSLATSEPDLKSNTGTRKLSAQNAKHDKEKEQSNEKTSKFKENELEDDCIEMIAVLDDILETEFAKEQNYGVQIREAKSVKDQLSCLKSGQTTTNTHRPNGRVCNSSKVHPLDTSL